MIIGGWNKRTKARLNRIRKLEVSGNDRKQRQVGSGRAEEGGLSAFTGTTLRYTPNLQVILRVVAVIICV